MTVFEEVCKSLFGDAVDSRELFAKMNPTSPDVHMNQADRKKRARTAALSAVGAAAGVGGFGLAGKKVGSAYLKARKAGAAVKPALKVGIKEEKGAAALFPLEVAGLGGELMATHILHGDVAKKPKKPKSFVTKNDFGPILNARRLGVISTEQALDLIDKAALPKPLVQVSSALKKVTAGVKQEKAAKTYANNIIQSGVNSVGRPTLHKLELVGAASGGVATGALGHKLLKKKKGPPATSALPKALPPVNVNVSGVKVNKSITWQGEISKVNEEKHQVFGWATVTEVDGVPVVDRQNDLVSLDEIEKAAYEYVISSRKGGDMHARDGAVPMQTADLIESFLVTDEKLAELGVNPSVVSKRGWWMGFHIKDDRQWELVKKGGRTGFSIHGKGHRTDRDL